MKQKIPILSIIAIIVLILLIVSAGVLQFTRLSIRSGMAPGGRPGGGGQMQGNPPDSGMNPSGGQDFQPGQGNGNQLPDRNDQGGSFGSNSGSSSGFDPSQFTAMQTRLKLMQLLRYAVGGLVILCGALAVLGVALKKKWSKVMTIIASAIVLAYTIPTMFNFRPGVSLILDIVKVVLAIAAIVLVLLPQKTALPAADVVPTTTGQ